MLGYLICCLSGARVGKLTTRSHCWDAQWNRNSHFLGFRSLLDTLAILDRFCAHFGYVSEHGCGRGFNLVSQWIRARRRQNEVLMVDGGSLSLLAGKMRVRCRSWISRAHDRDRENVSLGISSSPEGGRETEDEISRHWAEDSAALSPPGVIASNLHKEIEAKSIRKTALAVLTQYAFSRSLQIDALRCCLFPICPPLTPQNLRSHRQTKLKRCKPTLSLLFFFFFEYGETLRRACENSNIHNLSTKHDRQYKTIRVFHILKLPVSKCEDRTMNNFLDIKTQVSAANPRRAHLGYTCKTTVEIRDEARKNADDVFVSRFTLSLFVLFY